MGMIGFSHALTGGLPMDMGPAPAPTPPLPTLLPVAEGDVSYDPVGDEITVTVTAPGIYAGSYLVAASALEAGPVNLVAPVVLSDGTPELGETLSRQPGLWLYDARAPQPNLSQRWQEDHFGDGQFQDIPGATGPQFVLDEDDIGDQVRVIETATQGGVGAQSATSAALLVPAPPPAPILQTAPGITGAGVEMATLTADTSDIWTQNDVVVTVTDREYQLWVGGALTEGPQTTPTVTLPLGSVGQSYALQIRARAQGIWSDWTAIASGTVQAMLSLTSMADGELEIDNATGLITISVSAPAAFAGSYQANADELDTGPVPLAPPSLSQSGPVTVGTALVATPGLWLYDPDNGTLVGSSWQWQRDTGGDGSFADITGATTTSYQLTSADAGHDVRCIETLADPTGGRNSASPALSVTDPVGGYAADFTDDFSRPDAPLVDSPNWEQLYDESIPDTYANIVSNTAEFGLTGGSFLDQLHTHVVAPTGNPYARLTFLGSTGNNQRIVGPTILCTPGSTTFTGYGAIMHWTSGQIRVRRFGDGSNSDLVSHPHVLSPGDVLEITKDLGTNDIEVWLTPATGSRTRILTVTDATYGTGKSGVYAYSNDSGESVTIDNFECGSVS